MLPAGLPTKSEYVEPMTRAPTALALLFLAGTTMLVTGVLADGRGDWHGYAWQSIDVADCLPDTVGTRPCPPFHEKWDWKRDQWVDIAVTLDPNEQTVRLRQQLSDNDRRDTDYVCVTALVLDGDGHNLVAHHQNWLIHGGESRAADFTYRSPDLASASRIHIGSKQCRDGAGQDDDAYAAVLARMAPPQEPHG